MIINTHVQYASECRIQKVWKTPDFVEQGHILKKVDDGGTRTKPSMFNLNMPS